MMASFCSIECFVMGSHCRSVHIIKDDNYSDTEGECPKTTAIYTQLTDVTQQKTDAIINRMIKRLNIRLDGEE